MKLIQIMEDWEFKDIDPYAQPLYSTPAGRILRFALKPGQTVREHNAPHSPVFIMALKGMGAFSGADGKEQQFGPESLIIFEPGENHTIHALDEELVFVAFMHGSPSAQQA